jgi:C4-type Zn-finger protein
LSSDDDLVLACPLCDSTNIKMRVGNGKFNGEVKIPRGYCQACGGRFEEGVHRPRKTDAPGRRGLSKVLLDADPDAVGGESRAD